LLRDTNAYPADRVVPGGEVESVLRSWADHLTDTNQLQQAAGTYQELLDKVIASRPDPQNDLRDATALVAHLRVPRRSSRAKQTPELGPCAMSSRRIELWQGWNGKLPHNPFVRRQLELAVVR
jgi:hypothetical protein